MKEKTKFICDAEIESYPYTYKYIVQLWKIKTIRQEYFEQEMRSLVDTVEKDVLNGRPSGRELLSELSFLMGFAAKINIGIMMSETYSCKRPRFLDRELKAVAA